MQDRKGEASLACLPLSVATFHVGNRVSIIYIEYDIFNEEYNTVTTVYDLQIVDILSDQKKLTEFPLGKPLFGKFGTKTPESFLK